MDIRHIQAMDLAIAAAKDAATKGGVAIGAALFNEKGEIVSIGGSFVAISKDPTAHAEVNCIRTAAKLANSDDLYGLTLYSTLEPCHMCLSAAAWARIKTIYFGAYRKDVDASLFDIQGNFSDETEALRMNLREAVGMEAHGGIRESECAALLVSYNDQPHHATWSA